MRSVKKLNYKVPPSTRIIAFGCSYTYGHGLEDCWKDSFPTKHPSKYSFPSLLSIRLGVKCCNYSRPGGSNKYMWHQAMNVYKPMPDDVVINMWTNPNRSCSLHINDEQIKHIGPWQEDKTSIHYYKHLENDYESGYMSWLYTKSVNDYLKNKVKLVINGFVNYQRSIRNIDPIWNTVKCDIEFQPIGNKHPLAEDNNHWGPLAHAELSEELYKMIGERLSHV